MILTEPLVDREIQELHTGYHWLEDEIKRLRVENATLVDRHNRESHGTLSHEAMAYNDLKQENERLREDYKQLQRMHAQMCDVAAKRYREVERLRKQENHQWCREEIARKNTEVERLRADNKRLRKDNKLLRDPLAGFDGNEE